MFISKQELYEKLQYVTPRTFAYLNEIDYYNLLMIIEEHQISIPPIHQLRKTLRGSKIMKPKNRVDNCYIHLKDEIPTPINNEQLSFLHFYPRQQIHLILSAYSRMKSLKLQSQKHCLKLKFPLDQHSIRKEITPPQSSDKDNDILICLLQKLINEIIKCQVPVSLKNNSFEIKLPNYIIKVDLNYHEQQDHLYPLQYSIHAWHRDFQYLEISNTFMIPSLNDLIFHIQKLFLLIFQLPEHLARQEYSLSQYYFYSQCHTKD